MTYHINKIMSPNGVSMNEFEENVYKKIKNELVQSVIDKKVDTYFTNRNEIAHYYNVGKMIIDAQGGEAKAKYTSENDLKVGDTVVVNAKLKKWYETSETDDGYIAKINGVDQVSEETTEPDRYKVNLPGFHSATHSLF